VHGATVGKKIVLSILRIVWLHKRAGSKETARIKKETCLKLLDTGPVSRSRISVLTAF
jgi:hypothetical protein